ncbi:hypothetical protein BJV74DRAFT_436862 [Russula compacta]|nr:hypothetical protein BJV74DRAFT_436862 [Russula compacta]
MCRVDMLAHLCCLSTFQSCGLLTLLIKKAVSERNLLLSIRRTRYTYCIGQPYTSDAGPSLTGYQLSMRCGLPQI